MVFLTVLVWHQTELNDTPFLAVYEFTLVPLVDVRRNLAFVEFDAEVWNGETANTLHQVDVDGKTSKQGYFFSHSQAILHGGRVLWDYLIQERGEATTVYSAFRVDEALEKVVLHEGGQVTTSKQAVRRIRIFVNGHRGKVSANLTADNLVHYTLLK